MARETYQQELSALREAVVDLGEDVLEQLYDGLRALDAGEESLARSVVEGDAAINEHYLALESECIDLFALQQPVASDLRFVASSFKVLTDLERIGDLATNFGRYALAETRVTPPEVDVGALGADARDMVADALAAYETGDVERCYAVHRRDQDLDTLCLLASERVVRDLIEREVDAGDSWAIERLMDDVSWLLLSIRDVERVGDHAVNVAARTLYAAEGDPALIY